MPDSLRKLPRWAIATWVLLLVAVVGRVAFASPNSGTVVPIYLKAGERWIAGEDIYAAFWPLDIYRNPPGVAAFFAPWSLLPPKTAGILWRLLGVAIFLTGLAAWVRHLVRAGNVSDRTYPRDEVAKPVAHAPGSERIGPFAVIAAILIIPSFNNGQVNVLIVGCLLHAAVGVSRERFWSAAAWIAFASFFKVYPLAVGLLFCVAKPKFALRLLPAFVLAALLPFACHRPDYVANMHRAFLDFLELEGKYRLMLDRPPWDWTILPRMWSDVRIPAEVTKLVSGLAGLTFAALVWQVKRRRPEDAMAFAFNLGCVWMTLFGPATENATYTLIAPTAAVLFLRRPHPLAFVALVLFALPILRGLFPSGEVLPFRTAQPLGAMALLGVLLRERSSVCSATVLGPLRVVSPTAPPLREIVQPDRNHAG